MNKNTEWPTPISIKLNEDIFEDKYQKKNKSRPICGYHFDTVKHKNANEEVLMLVAIENAY